MIESEIVRLSVRRAWVPLIGEAARIYRQDVSIIFENFSLVKLFWDCRTLNITIPSSPIE